MLRSNELLKQLLEGALKLPVEYYDYEGTETAYITYNEESEQPTDYADDQPQSMLIHWQVHIFAPKAADFRNYKDTVRKSLITAGFTVTDIVTLYEKETKKIHVVISCRIEEGEE